MEGGVVCAPAKEATENETAISINAVILAQGTTRSMTLGNDHQVIEVIVCRAIIIAEAMTGISDVNDSTSPRLESCDDAVKKLTGEGENAKMGLEIKGNRS